MEMDPTATTHYTFWNNVTTIIKIRFFYFYFFGGCSAIRSNATSRCADIMQWLHFSPSIWINVVLC